MKKFFAVFVCSVFLISVLAFPSFADQVFDPDTQFVLTIHNTSQSEASISYTSQTVYNPLTVNISPHGNVILYLNYGDVYSLVTTGVLGSVPVSSYSDPAVLSSSHLSPSTFSTESLEIFYTELSSSVSAQYVLCVQPAVHVNSGVTSSIGFVGDVINFLTSNSTTIFVIGFSVAMLCVLPWGIRKLKGLIKGY